MSNIEFLKSIIDKTRSRIEEGTSIETPKSELEGYKTKISQIMGEDNWEEKAGEVMKFANRIRVHELFIKALEDSDVGTLSSTENVVAMIDDKAGLKPSKKHKKRKSRKRKSRKRKSRKRKSRKRIGKKSKRIK